MQAIAEHDFDISHELIPIKPPEPPLPPGRFPSAAACRLRKWIGNKYQWRECAKKGLYVLGRMRRMARRSRVCIEKGFDIGRNRVIPDAERGWHRSKGIASQAFFHRFLKGYNYEPVKEEEPMAKEVKFEASLELQRAITYLEEMASSLKDGKVVVERTEDFVVLEPTHQIQMQLDAAARRSPRAHIQAQLGEADRIRSEDIIHRTSRQGENRRGIRVGRARRRALLNVRGSRPLVRIFDCAGQKMKSNRRSKMRHQ